MRRLILALVLALLAGCASMEKDATLFEPLRMEGSNPVYRYRAIAGINNPPESEDAEKLRMEALQMWLADNELADRPYEILSRKMMVRSKSVFGPVYDIWYEVRVRK